MATEMKPIRSEADYEAALVEVAALWGTAGETPEGDRFDILATLIDVYEARLHPMDPPDPVEAIKFRMEQQGITRKDLPRSMRRWSLSASGAKKPVPSSVLQAY